MEIYKELGYDLLSSDHNSKSLFDLPKIKLMEDRDGAF